MYFNLKKKRNRVEFIEENGLRISAKVHYVFNDGTENIVDVDVETGEFVNVLFREEESSDRRQRRLVKCYLGSSNESNDEGDSEGGSRSYEGEWFVDHSLTPSEAYELELQQQEVEKFKSTLTPIQLRRFMLKWDDPSLSYHQIASIEHVDVTSIIECFDAIRKKFEKFKNIPPQK